MAHPPEPTGRRELFGGAITVDFPIRLVDVSDFRPVPDNQEVWTDAERDESVIVELVERVDVGPSDAEGAAVFFFRDLATIHDATVESGLSTIEEVLLLSEETHVPNLTGARARASLCRGVQRVAKGRDDGETKRNVVEVVLVCVRLPSVRTDVLLTLNRASSGAPGAGGSAGAPEAEAGQREGEETLSGKAVLLKVARSLRIQDWSLFG
jgi:hypothetical protein